MKDKFIKIFKSKAGLTFVELAIGFAIFAFVALDVGLVVFPTVRMYNRSAQMTQMNELSDSIAREIITDLSQTVSPAVIENYAAKKDKISFRNSSEDIVYSIGTLENNGLLLKNGEPLKDKLMYNNNSLSISYTELRTDSARPEVYGYEFTLNFLDTYGNNVLSKTYAVRPMLLDANQYY